MHSLQVDTPDKSFAWHWPVLALYSVFFVLGWLVHAHRETLSGFRNRCWVYLPLSLVLVLLVAAASAPTGEVHAWATEHASVFKWMIALGTSLTMSFGVAGWLGLFVRLFDRPRTWVRYLAESSYWVYLVHLPVVVALQISFVHWSTPWWIKWPLINALAFTVLIVSYHGLVRRTWLGAWLNGRRATAKPSGTAAVFSVQGGA
jgi:peptidoglycan/LPS O-acetylase OafA/YrhL